MNMTEDDETLTAETSAPAALPGTSVSARALMPLVAGLERAGVDIAGFLALHGIDGLKAALEADSDERFTSAKLEGIWEHAATTTGDPLFGLHAGATVEEHTFGVFSYLAATSATWGHALERVCCYFRLLTDSGRYELSAAGSTTVLGFRPEASLPVTPQLCDFVLAVPFQYGRRNVDDFRVLEVLLPYPEPVHGRELAHFFGARVRFSARALGLVFAGELMAAPLRAAAPELARVLEGVAAEKFAALPSNRDALAQVRQALHDTLRAGDASLDAVARRLGVTPRTLQRHLRAQGTGYAAELDIVRRELALVLVAQRLTLQEVAFLVGFSEAAAFHRAFRRWMGEAPGHYRSRIPRGVGGVQAVLSSNETRRRRPKL